LVQVEQEMPAVAPKLLLRLQRTARHLLSFHLTHLVAVAVVLRIIQQTVQTKEEWALPVEVLQDHRMVLLVQMEFPDSDLTVVVQIIQGQL
jgi:hypothetical protein